MKTLISARNILLLLLFLSAICSAQSSKEIFSALKKEAIYLPDFSYAGYHNGAKEISISPDKTIINALDFGVIPNDGLDDSKALKKTIEAAHKVKGAVVIQLPKGRIIVSTILYVERSRIILSGYGTGENGTEIYCPRPLMYAKNPESLKELRAYLVDQNKIQKEKLNNIHIPFSQYSWSGGFLWTQVPGERVKSYLKKYDTPLNVLSAVKKATKDTKELTVTSTKKLKKGAVIELQWFNKSGKNGQILKELYGNEAMFVGSHHWNYTNLPLVRQQVQITAIKGNTITIASPLLLNILPEYKVQIVEWKHLEEVGFQHFKITFPYSNRIAHHVEQGYNGIYLTRVFNSWVKDVVIENADSGILTEAIANVTIKDITTIGEKKGHYTVQMGGVHNVLVKNLQVKNEVMHPLSFNTFATKSVYTQCEVFKNPVLDQHSGVNHQNLFDHIKVHIIPKEDGSYPLFAGGGAKYWKPSHASYNSFWNIDVHFLNGIDTTKPILLNGMKDGPNARLIGIHGNNNINVTYEPKAYINFTNTSMLQIPSLYAYQLKERIGFKN